MRMLKRISLISFLFIVIFVLVGSFDIKVNGLVNQYNYSNLVTVNGAGIRTSGNQGLRFECNNKLTVYTLQPEFGALIAYGSKNSSGVDLTSEMIVNAYYATNAADKKINGYSILNAYTRETDSDGTYYVTVFNIPEDFYLQDITVVPYVCAISGEYVYGNAVVTRNIGEIALAHLNDGGTKTMLLDNIIYKLDTNYRKKVVDSRNDIFVDSVAYESDIYYINKEFCDDWNEDNPNNTIYAGCIYPEFINQLTINNHYDDCAALKSFFTKYHNKYAWLLEYIIEMSKETKIAEQAKYLLDNTYSISTEDWNNAYDLLIVMYCIFNNDDFSDFSLDINFKTVDIYHDISFYNKAIYTNLLDGERVIDIYKVGNQITLPAITETTGVYRWVSCEYNHSGTYEEEINNYKGNETVTILNGMYYIFTKKDIEITYTLSKDMDMSNETVYIEESNYVFDGNNKTYANANIVLSKKIENVTFTNVNFSNCSITNTALFINDIGYSAKDITFIDCTFNSSSIKFVENYYSSNTNIVIQSCDFSGELPTYPISIQNCENISIQYCNFETQSDAIEIIANPQEEGCGTPMVNGDVFIDSCTFYHCDGSYAIRIEKINNDEKGHIEISSCTFYDMDVYYSAIVFNGCNNTEKVSVDLKDNTVQENCLLTRSCNGSVLCNKDGTLYLVGFDGLQ